MKTFPLTPPAYAVGIEKTPVPIEALIDICRRPRFAGSEGEQHMITQYIESIDGVMKDAFGNYWVNIDKPDGSEPTTMFSSHTDTVHKKSAANLPYKLAIRDGMLRVKDGGVLGADDGAGIWLMLNLIEAKVPGLYIFHREEEIGGNGSSFIAQHFADMIKEMGIKHCIAFDRKGTRDLITHQMVGRCCSDDFATALAAALNTGPAKFIFQLDDSGSFTDSANYTDLIGECTNISVGYYAQHSTSESQDLTFISRLANQLIAIDWDSLPQVRQPGEVDPLDFATGNMWDDYDYLDADFPPEDINGRSSFQELLDLVGQYPAAAAYLLEDLGYDAYELRQYVDGIHGSLTAGQAI